MSALRDLIAAEIARPVAPAITSFGRALATRGGQATVAVLFYGSALRTGDLDGVLDFYVVVDSLRMWHGNALPAAANWALPPTIEFWRHSFEGQQLRAKVAVLSREQFGRRNRYDNLDTTVWARFAQPSALIWFRDSAARDVVIDDIAQAVITAARWSVAFGPTQGAADEFWRALFRRTFGTELRVETKDRADEIIAFARDRYRRLLPLAWSEAGVPFRETPDGVLCPTQTGKRSALRAWQSRRMLGKPLNILRLAKASFSFEGGVDYVLWKIERHSKVQLELTPWQRRHPILASPALLWRLWRAGVVR